MIHTPGHLLFQVQGTLHGPPPGGRQRAQEPSSAVRRRSAQSRVRWTSANHKNRIFMKTLKCSCAGHLEARVSRLCRWPCRVGVARCWRGRGHGGGGHAQEQGQPLRGGHVLGVDSVTRTANRACGEGQAGAGFPRSGPEAPRPRVSPAHGREDSLLESGALPQEEPLIRGLCLGRRPFVGILNRQSGTLSEGHEARTLP